MWFLTLEIALVVATMVTVITHCRRWLFASTPEPVVRALLSSWRRDPEFASQIAAKLPRALVPQLLVQANRQAIDGHVPAEIVDELVADAAPGDAALDALRVIPRVASTIAFAVAVFEIVRANTGGYGLLGLRAGAVERELIERVSLALASGIATAGLARAGRRELVRIRHLLRGECSRVEKSLRGVT